MIYRPFAILVAIGLLLALGSHFGLLQPVTHAFNAAIQPALAAETKTTRKSFNLINLLISIRDVNRENIELRKKNVELESQISQLKEVSHENDVLRQELKFTEQTKDQYIPAQLIGQTATGVIKDLIINRGSADNLKKGQAVVAQGHLVGVINAVNTHQSTVILLTNPQSLVSIMAQDSRASGVLRGGISGLTATDLLIDADVKVGENIVTSGLGGELPAGILIGQVVEVTSRKGDITKKASVRSPLDLSKLEMVFVRKVAAGD